MFRISSYRMIRLREVKGQEREGLEEVVNQSAAVMFLSREFCFHKSRGQNLRVGVYRISGYRIIRFWPLLCIVHFTRPLVFSSATVMFLSLEFCFHTSRGKNLRVGLYRISGYRIFQFWPLLCITHFTGHVSGLCSSNVSLSEVLFQRQQRTNPECRGGLDIRLPGNPILTIALYYALYWSCISQV